MHKFTNGWNNSIVVDDSSTESVPLILSASHKNTESVMFKGSKTNDSNCPPINGLSEPSYHKYGSIENSLHSNVTALPKKIGSVPANDDLQIPLALNISSSLNVTPERHCDIANTEQEFNTEKDKSNSKQSLLVGLTNGFLSESLYQETTETSYKDNISKQGSLVTIFSIWNTILGCSLLTVPWGIQMTGLFPGIILILVMSGLCLYTAYCLLLVDRYYGTQKGVEVTELCRIYLNKWAELIARAFSITVLLGAIIAYWILMSNFLYNSVNFIYDSIIGIQYRANDNSSNMLEVLCPRKTLHNSTNFINHNYTYSTLGPIWDLYKTVPIFLGLLIFPFLNISSPTFFTKFNSLGTLSVVYLIIFVLIKSVSWGVNIDTVEWGNSWTLKSSFPALSGMLALSFFIHNIIVTIMRNNRDQSKNGRDLSIAYLLVTLTYIIVGVVFYVCFPLSKSCIEDNLLNNFQKWSALTVGARIVLLFQLLTVYPLLAYMLRIELLTTICKTFNIGCVILVNIFLICICILFAMFVPYIGTIIRYTGALSGFVHVFTLPSLLYLAILRKQNKLTIYSMLLHTCIPMLGLLNLLAQFFIKES